MSERSSITEGADFEHLLSMGFSEGEASRLLDMKEHAAEHVEYRELLEQSRRLTFLRWLIEHDRISH